MSLKSLRSIHRVELMKQTNKIYKGKNTKAKTKNKEKQYENTHCSRPPRTEKFFQRTGAARGTNAEGGGTQR